MTHKSLRRAPHARAAVLIAALILGAPAVAVARPAVATPLASATTTTETSAGTSLETAASRASDLGRTVAFSLIGLALAITAVILVFRRDFKEAVGVLAIGLIAVLLASPAGLSVLQGTVSTLFGSG